MHKGFQSSLWKLIHSFKIFVVASTTNYCNSGVYLCMVARLVWHCWSLWVNAYHLFICLVTYLVSCCEFTVHMNHSLQLNLLCVWLHGKLCRLWAHKVHPVWPHQVYPLWPQSVNNSPIVPTMKSLCGQFSKWTHHEVTVHKLQEAIMCISSPCVHPVLVQFTKFILQEDIKMI